MASFIPTMFVPSSPSLNSFISPPKPLDPVFTPGESASYIQPPSPSLQSLFDAGTPNRYQQRHPDSPVKRFLDAAVRNGGHLPLSPRVTGEEKSEAQHELRRSNIVDDHLRSRTRAPFKPQKANRGTTSWQLKQFAEATLGSGSLRKAVKLPEGEDENEWLAVNGECTCPCTEDKKRANDLAIVVDFYNQINLLYGSITEFCSPQTCPEMKATDEFEYLWQDNENFKKPTKMPAPEYIEHLMAWVQGNIDNEQMFPSRIGRFIKNFTS